MVEVVADQEQPGGAREPRTFFRCTSGDELARLLQLLGVDGEFRQQEPGAPTRAPWMFTAQFVPCTIAEAVKLSERPDGASLRASHTKVAVMRDRIAAAKAAGIEASERSLL